MSAPRSMLAAAQPVVITLWPSRSNPLGRRNRLPWDTFVARFVADPEPSLAKEGVAGFALATFIGRRALANVEHVFALVLDFDDGGTTIDEATHLFPRARGAIYTTFSSTPDKPKLRLVLPFARPVVPEEYARLWAWAEARCSRRKHPIDRRACDASRLWYIPSHPIGCTTYEWTELPGRPLDVESLLTRLPPSFLGNNPSQQRRAGRRRTGRTGESPPPNEHCSGAPSRPPVSP